MAALEQVVERKGDGGKASADLTSSATRSGKPFSIIGAATPAGPHDLRNLVENHRGEQEVLDQQGEPTDLDQAEAGVCSDERKWA